MFGAWAACTLFRTLFKTRRHDGIWFGLQPKCKNYIKNIHAKWAEDIYIYIYITTSETQGSCMYLGAF